MSPVPAIILQTHDACPPGLVRNWADARGLEVEVVRVDRRFELPDPSGYACAVALGSYASLACRRPDWAAREVAWIRRADTVGVPILGICFGAQALAVALGGAVARLPSPELGWIELDTSDPELVPPGPWLTVHEDTIVLPPFAYEFARNRVGPQAFSIGRHLGVQFHAEATPALLAGWVADLSDELAEVGAELLADGRDRDRAASEAAFALFDGFAERADLELPGVAIPGQVSSS